MATMDLKRVYSLIQTAFSEDGYKKGAFTVKCFEDTQFNVECVGDTTRISFTGDLPKISFRKIIRISADVTGLFLEAKGGTLELNNFPDIPFEYES